MILGLVLIGLGFGLMAYSFALIIWTTLIRNRASPEPPWVIRAGCSTTALAFVLCTAGVIVSALSTI